MAQQVFRLFNSLTGKVEPFVAADPARITMYSCGPTVYDYAHIGNFRSFLFADVLRRWLESPLCALLDERGAAHAGPRRVLQVMNLTDVGHMTDDGAADGGGEDKMQAASRRLLEAKKSGRLPPDAPADFDPANPYHIAQFYEGAFLEDARLLGLKVAQERETNPKVMPRATEHVREMLALIRRLLDRGCAYVAPSGDAVYFDTQRFDDYGALSGNTLEKLRAGAGGRVSEANQGAKKHPADFLLWKKDSSHVMKWDPGAPEMLGAEAGPLKGMVGYPGWHVECSAMADSSIGALAGGRFDHTIDLHTGGEDNIFPHHECEIAQSRCAWGKDRFARQWAHARHLMVEGEKMSKSKGNFYTIRDLLEKGFDPAAIRLELIKTNYRNNANFTSQGLQDSQRRVQRWRRYAHFIHDMCRAEGLTSFENTSHTYDGLLALEEHSTLIWDVITHLHYDLNVAGAISGVDDFCAGMNDIGEVVLPHQPLTLPQLAYLSESFQYAHVMQLVELHLVDHILGVIFRPPHETPSQHDPRVDELRLARDAARKAKQWAESDRLRDELQAMGYEVKDTPQGTVVTKKAAL